MSNFVTDTECERVVADLLAMMSLHQMAGQLRVLPLPETGDREAIERLHDHISKGFVGAVAGISEVQEADLLQNIAQERSPLGIPLLFPHATGTGIDTIMPVPLSSAASWDMDIIEAAERAISQEAQARGYNWAMAPEMALSSVRDGGRGRDCGSEIHLAASVAAARIRGLQGDAYRSDPRMLACLDLSDVLAEACSRDPIDLLRIARPAIGDAKVGAIAFDGIGGRQREAVELAFGFLKGPGGFDGILLSEWDALERAATGKESSNRGQGLSVEAAATAVEAGKLDRDQLKTAAARVLRTKFRLGLLSAAHTGSRTFAAPSLPTPVRNREIALSLAKRSAILLRNEPRLLPLGIDSGDLLVVGSAAADRRLPLAGCTGLAASVIDGLEQLGIPHRFTPGLALREGNGCTGKMIAADQMAIGMACEAAKRTGTVILVLSQIEGAFAEADEKLLSALFAANSKLVLVSLGEAPTDPVVNGRQLPCILHAGQLGTMSGHAIAELLTGEASPSGKLPLDLPGTGGREGLPFGYGLTYSDFALTDLSVEYGREHICAFADLRNLGETDATETAQLYLRRHAASGSRQHEATIQLVDFQRVTLRPGERETLIFDLGREEFGVFTERGAFRVEPGRFDLFLGLSKRRGLAAEIDLGEDAARAMAGLGYIAIHQAEARQA